MQPRLVTLLGALALAGCAAATEGQPPTSVAEPDRGVSASPATQPEPDLIADAVRSVEGDLEKRNGAWVFVADDGTATLPIDGELGALVDRLGNPESARAHLRLAGGSLAGWSCVALSGSCGRGRDEETLVLAHGTEPFWALRITETEAIWTSPETPGERRWTRDGGGPNLEFVDPASGERLVVELRRDVCTDGMSDAFWSVDAQVRFDGYRLLGCASAAAELVK